MRRAQTYGARFLLAPRALRLGHGIAIFLARLVHAKSRDGIGADRAPLCLALFRLPAVAPRDWRGRFNVDYGHSVR